MNINQYVDKGKNIDLSSFVIPVSIPVVYQRGSKPVGVATAKVNEIGLKANINLTEWPVEASLYPAIIVQNDRLVCISLNHEKNADLTIKSIQWVEADTSISEEEKVAIKEVFTGEHIGEVLVGNNIFVSDKDNEADE